VNTTLIVYVFACLISVRFFEVIRTCRGYYFQLGRLNTMSTGVSTATLLHFYSQSREWTVRPCEYIISFVCGSMRDFCDFLNLRVIAVVTRSQLRRLNRRPTGVSTATLLHFYSQSVK